MEYTGTVMEFELPISMPGEVMEIFKNVKVMENGNLRNL